MAGATPASDLRARRQWRLCGGGDGRATPAPQAAARVGGGGVGGADGVGRAGAVGLRRRRPHVQHHLGAPRAQQRAQRDGRLGGAGAAGARGRRPQQLGALARGRRALGAAVRGRRNAGACRSQPHHPALRPAPSERAAAGGGATSGVGQRDGRRGQRRRRRRRRAARGLRHHPAPGQRLPLPRRLADVVGRARRVRGGGRPLGRAGQRGGVQRARQAQLQAPVGGTLLRQGARTLHDGQRRAHRRAKLRALGSGRARQERRLHLLPDAHQDVVRRALRLRRGLCMRDESLRRTRGRRCRADVTVTSVKRNVDAYNVTHRVGK